MSTEKLTRAYKLRGPFLMSPWKSKTFSLRYKLWATCGTSILGLHFPLVSSNFWFVAISLEKMIEGCLITAILESLLNFDQYHFGKSTQLRVGFFGSFHQLSDFFSQISDIFYPQSIILAIGVLIPKKRQICIVQCFNIELCMLAEKIAVYVPFEDLLKQNTI